MKKKISLLILIDGTLHPHCPHERDSFILGHQNHCFKHKGILSTNCEKTINCNLHTSKKHYLKNRSKGKVLQLFSLLKKILSDKKI